MSLKPIDLQTLFLKMNDVGKNQQAQKNAVSLQQSVEARELAEKELKRDQSVNKTPDSGETATVKEREEREASEGSSKKRKESPEEKDSPEEKTEYIEAEDPEIGNNIDITG